MNDDGYIYIYIYIYIYVCVCVCTYILRDDFPISFQRRIFSYFNFSGNKYKISFLFVLVLRTLSLSLSLSFRNFDDYFSIRIDKHQISLDFFLCCYCRRLYLFYLHFYLHFPVDPICHHHHYNHHHYNYHYYRVSPNHFFF